jgi:Glycosyl transferase family 2
MFFGINTDGVAVGVFRGMLSGMSILSVSVVIPCFNAAATVEETVASVSAQTMQDFEILAVDNNSTDNTLDALERISKREPRLRIIKQSVQGPSAARNAGIMAARGQIVAFLDADDLWDEDYLASHLASFADDDVGVSYARVRLIDQGGAPTGQVTRRLLSEPSASDFLRSNPCTALIVVRRNVFEAVGLYDQDLRSVEDQEWLFRAAIHGVRFKGIGRTLASYRTMPDGLTADLATMLKCHDQLLAAAVKMAPDLVVTHSRLARAGMLRYCARRAVEQGSRTGDAWNYLTGMFKAAPELLWHEPVTTSKVIARVLLSDFPSSVLSVVRRSREVGNAAR